MKYWYLGTPYTKYKDGIEEAYMEAARQAAFLIKEGIPVFCPITHTHPIAVYGSIDPTDHDIWLKVDQAMIDQAYGMIVCMLDGWEQSTGVTYEIKEFKRQNKTIIYMQPGEIPPEIRIELSKY